MKAVRYIKRMISTIRQKKPNITVTLRRKFKNEVLNLNHLLMKTN